MCRFKYLLLIFCFVFSCNASSEHAAGCQHVSSHESNLQTSLDPDRDLERIYSLIITHKDRFNCFTSRCETQAVYTGDICIRPSCIIEDVQSCFKTIKHLQEIIIELQQLHFIYQNTLARETKYGSK